MDMESESRLRSRRAIEALRNGVPSRDAVLSLGCNQPAIEKRFGDLLARAKIEARAGRGVQGFLLRGDFGTGKSHVLEYLKHQALQEGFVCSKIVISKETPLYDPVKFYRSAADAAVVPGRRGSALTEIAFALNFKSVDYEKLSEWLATEAELEGRFEATLELFRKVRSDQETAHRIIRFWAGDKLGASDVRRWLKSYGEPVRGRIRAVPARDLAMQRLRFVPRLIIAAGYAGWVLLVDEVELMGKYSRLQRARSYASLGRLLGASGEAPCGGLTAVAAITPDYESHVLYGRPEDLTRIPEFLQSRPKDMDLVPAAEAGMRMIREGFMDLAPVGAELLEEAYGKIENLYAHAYGWTPPRLSLARVDSSTRFRQYIKAWITAWDLQRLDPSYSPSIEVESVRPPDYTEDPDLTRSEDNETPPGMRE
jgi:hypothetical protein